MERHKAFEQWKLSVLLMAAWLFGIFLQPVSAQDTSYRIVGTGQTLCYGETGEIPCPSQGNPFYGQDAQYNRNKPSYTDNGDGTVTDNVTGLMWQKSPDTNGDGAIDAADKLTWAALQTYPETLNGKNFGGHSDWRLPNIKELYSLINFSGVDPSGYSGSDTSGLKPFIDTDYFDFAYGDTSVGERIIDSQYASSSLYVSTTTGMQTLFGVNFADGRIKGYGLQVLGSEKTFYVICVRGNAGYGVNDFADNGDGTITDKATGLMWSQNDSGVGLNWEKALAWVEQKNAQKYLGYNDWRLPSAKELQSVVDYSRSPDTTGSAAIDPLFHATSNTNEAGQSDYPCYWSSTTHANWTTMPGEAAAYVAFGRALGYMNGSWVDIHGAGAQRSDPKAGDPADYPWGRGPQGDAIRIYNFVRLVRNAASAGPWIGSVELGQGWKYLDWFGYFNDQWAPWIYHLQLGWIYSSSQNSSDIQLYSQDLDTWFWTAAGLFPWMYSPGESAWLYYLRDSFAPRWFYKDNLQQWEAK